VGNCHAHPHAGVHARGRGRRPSKNTRNMFALPPGWGCGVCRTVEGGFRCVSPCHEGSVFSRAGSPARGGHGRFARRVSHIGMKYLGTVVVGCGEGPGASRPGHRRDQQPPRRSVVSSTGREFGTRVPPTCVVCNVVHNGVCSKWRVPSSPTAFTLLSANTPPNGNVIR